MEASARQIDRGRPVVFDFEHRDALGTGHRRRHRVSARCRTETARRRGRPRPRQRRKIKRKKQAKRRRELSIVTLGSVETWIGGESDGAERRPGGRRDYYPHDFEKERRPVHGGREWRASMAVGVMGGRARAPECRGKNSVGDIKENAIVRHPAAKRVVLLVIGAEIVIQRRIKCAHGARRRDIAVQHGPRRRHDQVPIRCALSAVLMFRAPDLNVEGLP